MTDHEESKLQRITINLDQEGQESLRALQSFYPTRSITALMGRALAVWALVEADLTVDGYITFKDRAGDIVRLRIFP
jgi:hypothetical protein